MSPAPKYTLTTQQYLSSNFRVSVTFMWMFCTHSNRNRIGKITLNWEIIFSKLELGDAKFGFGRWEMGKKRLGDGKF